MKTAVARLTILLVFACALGPARAGEVPLRVLFVGNSLTYTNDLPAIVAALARASGGRRLSYETVAFPDYSLEDHWNRGEARRVVARGGWDVVVLQQGPSASDEGRAVLLEYARRFAEDARRVGARTALYMVWPSAARERDFDRSSESYRLAAEAVGGILLPVGEAWRAAWRRDAALELYASDGLHPTLAGSYLAALAVYARLFGRSPVGLPAELKKQGVRLSRERAATLQAAAAEADERFGR